MKLLLRYFVISICCFWFSLCAWAQESSITGSVRDASGGAVPHATITITSAEQAFSRTAISNASGDYLVSGLPAGIYNIDIRAQGFEQFRVTGLVLRVAEKSRADARLKVGQVSTQVTVAGTQVAQVQTESSELSGVITNKQINQLVLNGRNFTQLITLIPGVSNQTGQDEGVVGVEGNVLYSVNGGRTEYNNWEIDGGDNMDNGSNGTLNTYPNVDAIAEVKVLTSNYGAQYGRNGSATIEAVTKSGTQQFHGDLFEFVRNNDFNARNFFQQTVPEYKKNDYGFTVGGPFFIPKLYNTSKQKTFFFYSQEWRKEVVPPITYNQPVPSNQERQGNFSDVCPGAGSPVNASAYPGCPVNPSTGAYYPNNTVPVSAQAQAILPLLPMATSGSGANSFYVAAPAQFTNWHEELARVDQNITDKERFFVRYIHDSWNSTAPLWGTTSFPTAETAVNGPGTSFVANLTSTLSPSLLNEFAFSYTADHIYLSSVGDVQRPSNFDMPGIFDNGYRGLLPNVTIENTAEYGGGFNIGTGYAPWNNANPTYTFKDNVTKIIGGHNLSIGVYYVAAQKNEDSSTFADTQGSLTFNGTATGSTGNGFADFLTGNIYSFDQTNLITKYYNRYKIAEPYIQDDWHVTSKFTLNLGLRISLFGTYRDIYHTSYNWEPGAYNPANIGLNSDGTVSGNPFEGIVQCGVNGAPAGCMKGHLFNPAPRVGFAYDPTGSGKMAIRGGYGIFFEHTNGDEANTESLEDTPPLVLQETIYNIMGYQNVLPVGISSQPLNAIAIPNQAIWPYVQQWSFSVQRELASNTLLTVAYAGSKGTHLTDQVDANQIYPVTGSQNPYQPGQVITSADCTNAGAASPFVNSYGNTVMGPALNNLNVACGNVSPNAYRPYLGYGSITSLQLEANSNYNALQVSARRNVGALTLSLAYTWSHSIDDSSDRYDSTFVNSYDLAATRASSSFDQRQLVNMSYVYNLPFFTKPGLLRTLFGGWQWSGLFTYQSGTPFTISNGAYGDNAGVGNGVGTGSYVDVAGNPYAPVANSNVPGVAGPLLYNPAAFVEPTGLTFGNSGRNVLTNPSRWNLDTGIFKHFAIHDEKQAIEFRGEAFNVFNHTQWSAVNGSATCYAGPTNSAGDSSCIASGNTFLTATAAHNPRILQLGMKFIF